MLAHELDLTPFAPLSALQVYYLVLALERREPALAAYINACCPEAPPLDEAAARAAAPIATAALATPLHKYSLLVQVFADPWFSFMNYGYLPDGAPALRGDEPVWPHAARMYERVVRDVPLAGADVLEVGCGRGGGAAHLARIAGVRSLLATDGCASNVMFARARAPVAGLRFEHTLAEQLAAPDASFDVVVNVESCKYYRPLGAFIAGVHRVLRPGGWLALAVFGPREVVDRIGAAIAAGGFALRGREHITSAVAAAIASTRAALPATLADLPCRHPKHHYLTMFDTVFAFDVSRAGTAEYDVFAFERR